MTSHPAESTSSFRWDNFMEEWGSRGVRTQMQKVQPSALFAFQSRETRQVGRVNPAGAAHMDVRRFRRRRMRLAEIPGPVADPAALSPGATVGCVSLVTVFAQAKKVTRAKREMLWLRSKR